jgi:hypothetical protein
MFLFLFKPGIGAGVQNWQKICCYCGTRKCNSFQELFAETPEEIQVDLLLNTICNLVHMRLAH